MIGLFINVVTPCFANQPEKTLPLSVDEKVEQLATNAKNNNDLVSIKKEIQDVVKGNETSGNAYYWLGRIYLKEGNLELAIQSYRKSIKNNPLGSSVRIELAKLLIQNEKYSEALHELGFVLSAQVNNLGARKTRADAYFQSGKLELAIKEYVSLVRLSPTHPFAKTAKTKLNILYFRKAEDIALRLNSVAEIDKATQMCNTWISQSLFDPAQWLLDKVLDFNAKHTKANYLLGVVYSRKGQLQKAIKHLSITVTYASQNIDYLTAYASVLSRAGYLNKAERIYLKISKIEKHNKTSNGSRKAISLIRGEKLVRKGEFRQALQYYRDLLETDAQNVILLTRISDLYMSLGNKGTANKYLKIKNRLEKNSRKQSQYMSQGHSFITAGRYAEARSTFEKLIKINPTSSKAYYWLSVISQKQKKYEEAISYIQKSIQYAPTNLAIKKEYARLLVQTGRLKFASEYYNTLAGSQQKAAEKRELRRLGKFVKGQYYLQNLQMQEALSLYQAMVLQFPNDISVLEALANVYVQLNFYSEAEEIYYKALELDDKRPLTYLRLAGLYSILGAYKESMYNYRQAFKLDPLGSSGKTAITNMLAIAQAKFDSGHIKEAYNELKTILELMPNHIVALSNAAIAAEKIDLNQDALTFYHRIIQNVPGNVEIRMTLGHLLVSMENYDAAINEFESIYELGPTSIAGREALANLDIVYNTKADQIISNLSTDRERTEAVKTAQIWIDKKKQIGPAQKILKAVLEEDSNNERAHYWLGSIYDQFRVFDLAVLHISTSVSLAPDNLQLLSAFGRVLARSGNFDSAEAIYTKVINEARGTPLANETRILKDYVVGLRLIGQERFTDALVHYKDMQRELPFDMNLQMRIGNLYLSMGDARKAENIYKAILSRNPDHAAAYIKLAEIYQERGDSENYLIALKQAIALDPNGVVGQNALNKLGLADGITYIKQKKWNEAMLAFNSVLSVDPGNLDAHIGIATVHLGIGDYNRSELLLRDILNKNPANLQARLKMARVLIMTKRTSAAVLELERIVAVSTLTKEGKEALLNLTNIFRQRGAALMKRGRADEAVVEYRKSLTRDSNDWRSHFALGKIFQSASANANPTQASKFLETAEFHFIETNRINPDFLDSYISLGSIYEVRQEYDSATNAFLNALSKISTKQIQKTNILANGVRIQVVRKEFTKQNFEWALTELNDMILVQPNSSRLYLFLSTVYIRLDELEKAIDALKKVVSLAPVNIPARFRLGQLYEQTNELERAAGQYRDIIFSRRGGAIVGAARERLILVEEKMQLLTFGMRYSNSLSATKLESAALSKSFNSSLQFDIVAHYQPVKGIDLSFTANPSYSTFHDSESDSLVSSYGITANFNNKLGYIIANVNQSETQGLLTEEVRGKEKSASITEGLRVKIPLFLSEKGSVLPSTLQGRFNVREFISEDFTFYDVRTYSVSGLYAHPRRNGGSINAVYQYANTVNIEELGSDYANTAHSVSLRINQPLASRLSGYVSASLSYEKYKNFDSTQYSPTPIRKRRKTGQVSFGAGLSYQIHRKLRLFIDGSVAEHRTNMQRSLIYNSLGEVRGIQSTTHEDYKSIRLSSGFQFRF